MRWIVEIQSWLELHLPHGMMRKGSSQRWTDCAEASLEFVDLVEVSLPSGVGCASGAHWGGLTDAEECSIRIHPHGKAWSSFTQFAVNPGLHTLCVDRIFPPIFLTQRKLFPETFFEICYLFPKALLKKNWKFCHKMERMLCWHWLFHWAPDSVKHTVCFFFNCVHSKCKGVWPNTAWQEKVFILLENEVWLHCSNTARQGASGTQLYGDKLVETETKTSLSLRPLSCLCQISNMERSGVHRHNHRRRVNLNKRETYFNLWLELKNCDGCWNITHQLWAGVCDCFAHSHYSTMDFSSHDRTTRVVAGYATFLTGLRRIWRLIEWTRKFGSSRNIGTWNGHSHRCQRYTETTDLHVEDSKHSPAKVQSLPKIATQQDSSVVIMLTHQTEPLHRCEDYSC